MVKAVRSDKQAAAVRLYLFGYNLVQTLGWSLILYQLISFYLSPGTRTLYESIRYALNIFQNAAVLEVVHAAIGLVKSNAIMTAFQVASRVVVVCGVLLATDSAKECLGLPLALIAWSVTEIIRYSNYAFNLVAWVPYFLKYLRLQTAHKRAKEFIDKAKCDRKAYVDLKSTQLSLKPGDLVLVSNEDRHKLDPWYDGPLTIIKVQGPNCVVKDNRGKESLIHKNRLKKYIMYTTFIVLYPIGVTGELLCIWTAQHEVGKGQLYLLEMPNKYNFIFNYQHVLWFLMLLYIPLFPQLYFYMFGQRKKALGTSKHKSN